jgi:hypothetical protein
MLRPGNRQGDEGNHCELKVPSGRAIRAGTGEGRGMGRLTAKGTWTYSSTGCPRSYAAPRGNASARPNDTIGVKLEREPFIARA